MFEVGKYFTAILISSSIMDIYYVAVLTLILQLVSATNAPVI